MEATSPILSVEGVGRTFGGLKAVDDVSFSLAPGQVRALIGPNGAGKSTVVNLMSGALAPSSGRILLEGVNVAGLRADQLVRRGIVRTFQNGRLFPRLSVVENVLVGTDARTRSGLGALIVRSPAFRGEQKQLMSEAREVLGHLGLDDLADRAVGSLPYGKQRQVELARALIAKPKVLLLDEPAAGLNSGEADVLLEFVQGLRATGMAVLLIEHNMGLVMRLADRITVMNFGKKISEGTPDEVRLDETVIEAYLGRRKQHA